MEHLKGKVLKLKGDLSLVCIEDQAALLDVGKRCYYDVNETALLLLKLMEDGCPYDNMELELANAFDVAGARARSDIDSFVENALRLGIVDVGPGVMAHAGAGKGAQEKKAYRAPSLEQQAEIAVASAAAPPTPSATF